MTKTILSVLAVLAVAFTGAVLIGSRGGVAGDDAGVRVEPPRHDAPPSASGNLVVALCDGQTAAEIPGVKEGETPTREQAQAVVDQLMTEWRQKNPDADWQTEPMRIAQAGSPAPGAVPQAGGAPDTASEREDANRKLSGTAGDQPNVRQPAPAPAGTAGSPPVAKGGAAADAPAAAAQAGATKPEQAESTGRAGGLPSGAQGDLQAGHTYGAFSERDERIWQAETERFVKEGHRVFHDAKAFGGTIGVSCDMCHPDGANTHPETYPKFQVQLGRVALLRDMINWCIQNPTRGKPLPDDDDRIKAMEAYILAQRKGTPLDFGKH
jgi:hypothetical protein